MSFAAHEHVHGGVEGVGVEGRALLAAELIGGSALMPESGSLASGTTDTSLVPSKSRSLAAKPALIPTESTLSLSTPKSASLGACSTSTASELTAESLSLVATELPLLAYAATVTATTPSLPVSSVVGEGKAAASSSGFTRG